MTAGLDSVKWQLMDMELVGVASTLEDARTIAENEGEDVEPILWEMMKKGGLMFPSAVSDYADQTFVCYTWNNGFEAYPRIFKELPNGKIDPAGWELRFPLLPQFNNIKHKSDGAGVTLVGNTLKVYVASHATNDGERYMVIWRARLPIAVAFPKLVLDAPRPRRSGRPYAGVGEVVTMGRLFKMLSNAMGYNEKVDGIHTFEDVPPGSPFHAFAERLFIHGILSGKPPQ